ncbi:MAG: hypothetical protein AAGC68_11675 [Verrucomicrobiota bacterium]
MKPAIILGALTLAFAFAATSGQAQIRDDDPSANILAVQCAVSSGYSADNYREYGEKLAKTIGMLSPVQQERVFGYVPQPYGAINDGVGSDQGGKGSSDGNADGGVGNSNGGGGDDDSTPAGGVVSLPKPDPETGEPSQPNANNPGEEEPERSDSGSSWWDDFLGWFGDLLESLEEDYAKK